MMSLAPMLGETVTVTMITSGSDGAAIDADAPGPTCAVFEDSNDTPILTPTVTKRAALVGTYRASVVCSTANGFDAGKTYEVVGKATVGGKVASRVLDRFVLRAYSVDGTNVTYINGQPAALDTTASGTLTPGERTAIAVAVKTNTGNNTTAGSIGQQSKDVYDAMLLYGGVQITGTIDISPTPTTSAFNVTLTVPLSSAKIANGITGQFCTVRDGGAQTEANPITGCVINSLSSLSLTFSSPAVFSVAPSAITPTPVSISE